MATRAGCLLLASTMRSSIFAAAVSAAFLGAAACAAPPQVLVQPDPFARLDTLQAGQIGSLWSSLPPDRDCAPGTRRLGGEALVLAPESSTGDGQPLGQFSLVD